MKLVECTIPGGASVWLLQREAARLLGGGRVKLAGPDALAWLRRWGNSRPASAISNVRLDAKP